MKESQLIKPEEDFNSIDRDLIKKSLLKSDMKKIANKAECSVSLVYKVLGGSKTNINILSIALDFAIANIKEKDSIFEKFEKVRSKQT
jgi:predicted transcriptional regulator